MASFGNSTWIERGNGSGSGVSYSSRAAGKRLHIPGGNKVWVWRNSSTQYTLDTEAECTGEQLDALRALIGTADTLTLSKTSGPAMLLSISPAQVFANDRFVVKLSFRWQGYGYGSPFGYYP